jgi:hypothetical protein
VIEYRILPKAEWPKLKTIFEQYNCRMPIEGEIAVGEEGGKIVSVQCIHKVVHLGPVWIHPDHRHQHKWGPLQAFAEQNLPEGFDYYYQFGTTENQSQLTRMNVRPLGWTVWGKRVN